MKRRYSYKDTPIKEGRPFDSDKGRHTSKWANWPDAKKRAEGIDWVEIANQPEVDHRFYKVVDGSEVNGVVEQVAVAKGIEEIKERLKSYVLAKTLNPDITSVLERENVQDINQAIGSYLAQVNSHGYSLLKQIRSAKTAQELESIDLDAGWPK